MRNIFCIFFLSGFIAFACFNFAQAANPLDMVISEIAWMGTEASYADEWVELYNNTEFPLDLNGWILKAADGTPEINLTGAVLAKDFHLLERTDDNAVSDITADQIYAGTLKNNGEALELYDNFGSLIDKINCSSGWFAGDNQTKQTMERKNYLLPGSYPDNWRTSQSPAGTPKAKNSIITETKPPVEEPQGQSLISENTFGEQARELEEELPGALRNGSPGVALITSAIAIFSGAIIFLLKKEVEKIYNK